MAIEKKWHLVLIRRNWEKKISETLNKKNIETFFPVAPIKKMNWLEKRNEIMSPIFPSHLFINILNQQHFTLVGQTKGVLNFYYKLSEPAIVNEEDVNTIKLFLKLYQDVNFEKGKIGISTDIKKDSRVVQYKAASTGGEETEKIFLPSIGYYMTGRLSKTIDPKIIYVDHNNPVSNNLFLAYANNDDNSITVM